MKPDDLSMLWSVFSGEQFPDGLLQPAEVQHGRPEEAEEAEDKESHPLIIHAAKPKFKKNTCSYLLNLFGKVTLWSTMSFWKDEKSQPCYLPLQN